MKKESKDIILKIHEIGTHTFHGAFLFSILRRGFFRTFLFKALLFITPRRLRVALATNISEDTHKTHVDIIVDDPDNNLLVYMNVVSTYTFLVGSNNFSMLQALRELRQIFRKAQWRLALEGKESEDINTLLSLYENSKVISTP